MLIGKKGDFMEIRNRIRELRLMRAGDLVPNPRNWRLHPKLQREAMQGVLKELGYTDALIARELPDGKLMMLDGHLRAEITPDTLVPVLIVDVTAEEADKILLTLDPIGAMASADTARLSELLDQVKFESGTVDAVLEGLREEYELNSSAALAAALDQDGAPEPNFEKADELRAKWATELGQLWQIGPHRLICGDSGDGEVVNRLLQDTGRKIRMVWTDPPYGVSYSKKNECLNRSDRGSRVQTPIANDSLKPAALKVMFQSALKATLNHAVEGAVCYASVPSGTLLPVFIAAFNDSGFTHRHTLVWVKNQFVIGMADYHSRFELLLYGWLDGPHYFTSDRSHDNVFEYDKPRCSDLHPTTKPVGLVGQMIANSSRRGELVYDPFCGSGTTIIAAHQLGRIGYGCECEPRYLAVELERLADCGLQPEKIE